MTGATVTRAVYAPGDRSRPPEFARALTGIVKSGARTTRSAAGGPGISGWGVFMLFLGGVFAYSAFKGTTLTGTLHDLLSNQNPATDPAAKAPVPGDTTGLLPHVPPGNQVSSTSAHNMQIGKMLATQRGWGSGPNWSALVKLWTRESGWRNKARNPSSGAYGIPQALPPSKMPPAAQAPPIGVSDPTTQIQWGLDYIASRYGNPINAWAHETSHGWY